MVNIRDGELEWSDKFSKLDAGYMRVPTGSVDRGQEEWCFKCLNFDPGPDRQEGTLNPRCMIVEGSIDPFYTCDLFDPINNLGREQLNLELAMGKHLYKDLYGWKSQYGRDLKNRRRGYR